MGNLDLDSPFTNISLDETIDICVNRLFINTVLLKVLQSHNLNSDFKVRFPQPLSIIAIQKAFHLINFFLVILLFGELHVQSSHWSCAFQPPTPYVKLYNHIFVKLPFNVLESELHCLAFFYKLAFFIN